VPERRSEFGSATPTLRYSTARANVRRLVNPLVGSSSHGHGRMHLDPSSALHYARVHRQRFVEELKEFLRFPTVSANSKYTPDIERCARWLASQLSRIGLDEVKIIPTDLHPIVYAASKHRRSRPTVLIYGHYDVQPADPLSEWRSPPFSPVVRGDDLFGRGASDDKGQLFTHVKALESFLQTRNSLPVNVKCVFEGEEEIRGPHLLGFIAQNRHALESDVAVISDTRILTPDQPVITYAGRGSLSLEVSVRGPRHDLHSGNFGGAVHDPLQALCEIVAKLHDPDGHVKIPGFYDRVFEASPQERAHLMRTGPSDSQILRDAGENVGWGETGYSLYERTTLRPALTVNGISGGYQGPGNKDVIPANAVAKLSFRLVPNQDPFEIDRLFRRHIARVAPPTVRTKVRTLSVAKPALIDPKHPAIRAAALAYRKGFGAVPVLLRSGGTIHVISALSEILGIPSVLLGFALPDDRMHAPNEKFHLPNFYKGIATSIWFLTLLGASQSLGKHRRQHEVEDAVLTM
jgi:acetylornithine deacetylase/succinyl-diaminopimelate desuccinylase-like protein